MTSELRLDRIEFQDIKVKVNNKAKRVVEENVPQLRVDFEKYNLYHRSKVIFPDTEVNDPRHFALTYGVKLESKNGKDLMPYEIEIEALAFLNYDGDELQGADRFRAVRFTGYQMLHGAIREMISNLTARSRHGLLQLPSRNFNPIAKREAEEDERERVEQAAQQSAPPPIATPKRKVAAIKKSPSTAKRSTKSD